MVLDTYLQPSTYLQPNTCLQTITCLQPDACSQLILGPFIYPSVPVGLGAPIRRVVALSCLRVTNTGSTAMARESLYTKLVC